MENPPPHSDPCLHHAQRQWLPHLEQGIAALNRQDYTVAQTALAEAIRISAGFHPLFHFLESGLNTELAILHLRAADWQKAEQFFTRAVFLHHDNATALAGKAEAAAQQQEARLPPYDARALSAGLTPPTPYSGIHALWRQASAEAAPALYEQAIAACEITHAAYHQAAALPWLYRAECFLRMGEDLLARNDMRRGMDLDRENAALKALSLRLAAA